MGRKIIDTYPVITLTIGTDGPRFSSQIMSPEDAGDAEVEALDVINTVFKRELGRNFDVDSKLVSEAVCEHCRSRWVAAGADYNDGCCGKDEANSPQRLVCLQSLIDEVEVGDFFRWDADRGWDRVRIDWPWALACAVDAWLKAGRPADGVAHLLSVAHRVKSSDWCTVWSDPGPGGCSLARLPDRVSQDERPTQFADELLSLIDDMGLLPARQAVA